MVTDADNPARSRLTVTGDEEGFASAMPERIVPDETTYARNADSGFVAWTLASVAATPPVVYVKIQKAPGVCEPLGVTCIEPVANDDDAGGAKANPLWGASV
jgi:hypothetical protein